MIKTINYYCRKFSPRSQSNRIGLNVSHSSGVAPNKPILILSIIELIQQRQLQPNRIELSAELIATFLKLWSDLGIERKADIGLPFFHLRSDGFWHFKAKEGFEFLESSESKIKVRTVRSLREAVEYAYLDPELFALLNDPPFRDQLTMVLIDSWFSDKTSQIQRSLSTNVIADLEGQLLKTGGRIYQLKELEKEDEQQKIVRSGFFRRVVTTVYGYRCAFCGLQIFNNLDNIVDGAHIKPFSQFYDDRISNGLSLCKNHHWAFDRFWFTLNEDYTIKVAKQLHENSPHGQPMQSFAGQPIYLPANREYYPSPEAIAWHHNTFNEQQGA